MQNATDEEIRAYLKWLWKEGLKPTTKGKGNIRRDLSNEKSAVYAAISEAFKSKSRGCIAMISGSSSNLNTSM